MRITTLLWDEENVHHIARHGVEPAEVEEVCFSNPLILRGRDDLHYVMGQSESGRYLFVVIRAKGKGRARVITARNMTESEKRRAKRR